MIRHRQPTTVDGYRRLQTRVRKLLAELDAENTGRDGIPRPLPPGDSILFDRCVQALDISAQAIRELKETGKDVDTDG